MSSGDVDAELVEQLARRAPGDPVALNELLRVVRPEVFRRCQRFLPNPLDAEDACQEALLATARRIGSFEGRSKFSSWLYQVVVNSSLDCYRRLQRRRSMLGESFEPVDAQRTSVIAGTRLDLMEALKVMNPLYGQPVVLRDVCDLDYAEIGRLLDVPEATAKTRVRLGRQRLRRLLSPS
ncbi:MAG: RNA polymerase sigma factor [Acidimicrobiales bacterium]